MVNVMCILLAKKLLIISRWQQHNIRPRLGPSNMGSVINCRVACPWGWPHHPSCTLGLHCYSYGACLPIKLWRLFQNSLIHFLHSCIIIHIYLILEYVLCSWKLIHIINEKLLTNCFIKKLTSIHKWGLIYS